MKMKLFTIIFLIFLSGCSPIKNSVIDTTSSNKNTAGMKKKQSYRVRGKRYQVMKSSKNYNENGVASWYGKRFNKRKTSSGERFNINKMTAAHKTLPLDTKVLVTNLKNGRQVLVKINDRGPFIPDRLIDLSYGAAKKLGILGRGVAEVNIKAIENEELLSSL